MHDFSKLCDSAVAARENAHCPYSQFPVGAALLTKTGEIFTGCNMENASFGLTICAERVAVGNAVAAGFTEFVAMALATDRDASPCGACRQVLAEFCDGDFPVYIHDISGNTTREVALGDLLPDTFRFDD